MTQFWQAKTLAELTDTEWESLCDGCARCCMVKLQDEDTDEVVYTSIVCDLLDQQACRCTRYPERHALVTDCVELSVAKVSEFHWLPKSCAYRTIAEGRDLCMAELMLQQRRRRGYHRFPGAGVLWNSVLTRIQF